MHSNIQGKSTNTAIAYESTGSQQHAILDNSMVPNKILKEVTLTQEQVELLKFDRSLHKVEQVTKL